MPYAPVPFNVCPCCGTEFGVDDRKRTHYELRVDWIQAGMPWFDDITSPTIDWNPLLQLASTRLAVDSPFRITGERSENNQESAFVSRPLWNRRDLERFTITSAQVHA
jgi:hypothetical protein